MLARLPSRFAFAQPGPSTAPETGDSGAWSQRLVAEPTVQTRSDARNMQKLGCGEAQFVGMPPEVAVPDETPTSVFSPSMRVELAPSSRFAGDVEISHGYAPVDVPRKKTPSFRPMFCDGPQGGGSEG